jgi:serine/threonine protein kinase
LSYNFFMPEWLGKTVNGVRIEKLLARGGTAEVYLGSHMGLERPVAVKILHSYIEEEPLFLEQFRREARVVAGLRHPSIVKVFDYGTTDDHPLIIMEYLRGPTLASYLRHLHEQKKRLPPDQIAQLLSQVSGALDYAHAQGVVHGDIKPGNILLHSKTEEFPLDRSLPADIEAVITDFGLMRIISLASHTESGLVQGTPAYMSPEQAWGGPIDHRSDIYALGAVLYEMLSGRIPFEADSALTVLHMQIHAILPPIVGVSPAVQEVVNRAMDKNPESRYQSSRELAFDFSRAIGMHALGVNAEIHSLREKHSSIAVQPEIVKSTQGQNTGKGALETTQDILNNKPNHNRKKHGTKSTSKLETSISYPMLLSKRFASPFLLQYYFPQQRTDAQGNIAAEFEAQEVNEYRQPSLVNPRQKVRAKMFSHAFDFSEPITRALDQDINVFKFLGTPKDSCVQGFHKILISISDEVSGQEIESITITAQVVDFAFDHISRPLLSRISASILSVGSFVMFLMGLLEQIDTTLGITGGTAAGVLAVFVYGNFYNLYQRIRLTNP